MQNIEIEEVAATEREQAFINNFIKEIIKLVAETEIDAHRVNQLLAAVIGVFLGHIPDNNFDEFSTHWLHNLCQGSLIQAHEFKKRVEKSQH